MSDILFGPGSFNGIVLLAGCALLALAFGITALAAFALGHRRAAAAALVLSILNVVAAGYGQTLTDINGSWHNANRADWPDESLAPWFFICLWVFWWLRRASGAIIAGTAVAAPVALFLLVNLLCALSLAGYASAAAEGHGLVLPFQ